MAPAIQWHWTAYKLQTEENTQHCKIQVYTRETSRITCKQGILEYGISCLGNYKHDQNMDAYYSLLSKIS